MSDYRATVKIKSDNAEHDGFIVINEADFDAEKHELYDAEKPKGRAKKVKEGGEE